MRPDHPHRRPASTATDYPDRLRKRPIPRPRERQGLHLPDQQLHPAGSLTIAQLYKCRWQVELFFKWIKQHLRIKRFYGTSENAVKSQIWIAVSVYVLIAIVKKRLAINASLYTILQVLSLTVFEKTPLLQLLTNPETTTPIHPHANQLNLFDY